MINVEVDFNPTVRCNLTARQWQLFTATKDCDGAAFDLNRAVEEAVEMYPHDRNAAHKMIYKEQVRLADFGAWDSEPCAVVEELLDEVYK